ncbi:MAG: hypothetical protein V7L09_13165 [Nostoc sp.]
MIIAKLGGQWGKLRSQFLVDFPNIVSSRVWLKTYNLDRTSAPFDFATSAPFPAGRYANDCAQGKLLGTSQGKSLCYQGGWGKRRFRFLHRSGNRK